MKRFAFLSLLLFGFLEGNTQEISIKNQLAESTSDIRGRTQPEVDPVNKDSCALILVALPLKDVKFGGLVVKQVEGPGEYMVYVPVYSKHINIRHSSFLPFKYEFPKDVVLKKLGTYNVSFEIPEGMESVVNIQTNAKKSKLTLNGETYNTDNGTFEVRVPKGEYDYELSSELTGFTPNSGKINVDDVYLSKRIELTTEKNYKLTIRADENAQIIIDGVEQQKRGSFQVDLPAGLHTVQAVAGDRWLPKQVEVDMTNGNAVADLAMRGNLRIIYPKNAEFEITPINNALSPSKKKIKTGEIISLLGDYDIKVIKKNYEETHANVFVNTNANIDNFRIEVTSKADNYYYGINGTRQDFRKAMKEYEKMADKNDEIAQLMLARCYERGYGGIKNLNKAREYYAKASEMGEPEATYSLAYLTQDDYQRAQLYIKAADQGNLASMQIAGDYYFKKKEYANAYKYYSLAATEDGTKRNEKTNDIKANCLASIGELYYRGLSVPQDYETAKKYFEDASDIGNTLADERLADFLYFGFNGVPNKIAAIEQYKSLGDKASDEAKLRIALFEYDRENYVTANEYFSKLMQSNITLPDDIGDIYYRMGGEMYQKDVPASFYYYNTALEKGIQKPRQMVRLGYMHMNGKGTSVDFPKAKACFEKATQLKDAEGICMLGFMHERGRGTPINKNKAIELYLSSGKAGYMRAYNNLGTLYANEKDMEKAVYYWELAGKAGNKSAIGNLITYYKSKRNKEKEEFWKEQQSKYASTK